jgi:hypothetical protein
MIQIRKTVEIHNARDMVDGFFDAGSGGGGGSADLGDGGVPGGMATVCPLAAAAEVVVRSPSGGVPGNMAVPQAVPRTPVGLCNAGVYAGHGKGVPSAPAVMRSDGGYAGPGGMGVPNTPGRGRSMMAVPNTDLPSSGGGDHSARSRSRAARFISPPRHGHIATWNLYAASSATTNAPATGPPH